MEKRSIKTLSDYKEDIHHCSKCGICQSACPVYELTGNECTVSRGQFIMLNGVVKNELKMSKNINKYLDLCLKCNKCAKACPSELEVLDILLAAKHEYFKTSVQGRIYSFLESKPVFNTLIKLLKFVGNIFCKCKKSKQFETKAVYFGGCIPQSRDFVVDLLNSMQIELIDVDFNCCGMPFITTGNLERFAEQAKENISKLPDGVQYVVTDCASCEWAWEQYSKYADFPEVQIKSLYDMIAEKGVRFEAKKKQKITYHKPCHEEHFESVQKIIGSVENVDFVELDGSDECCGFAGFEHPQTLKTLKPLFDKKKDNIKKSGADIVLTTCSGCLISLNMITKGKAKRLISYLGKNCRIK